VSLYRRWLGLLLKGRSTEFIRFLIIGSTTALINMAVYGGLVYLGAHYLAASGVGWVLGVAYAFLLNKRFTFRAEGKVSTEALRTLLVYVCQLGVSWAGLALLVEVFKLHPYLAYLINTVVVTAVSFLGLKFFAFRVKAAGAAPPPRP
jgi:putative flippase GtrA